MKRTQSISEWVKVHIGVKGNEIADTQLKSRMTIPISKNHIKLLLKDNLIKR